ncbi:MAG: hypothetical protein ACREAC_04425, partial [Blastocatellia bacterium]
MSHRRQLPVFYDPDQKRWPRLRHGVFVTAFAISCLFGLLIFSVLVNPILPGLNLPSSSFLPNGAHLAPATETIKPLETPRQQAIREAKQKIERERALRRVSFSENASPPAPAGAPLTFAFYVNDDEASYSSLKQNLDTPEVSIDV